MPRPISIADSWILALCAYMIDQSLTEARISPQAMQEFHSMQPHFQWTVDEKTRDIVMSRV